MGGGQSAENPAKGGEEEEGPPGRPCKEVPAAQEERPSESAGDVPQCRMGGRTVDSMCFMISCTNWY